MHIQYIKAIQFPIIQRLDIKYEFKIFVINDFLLGWLVKTIIFIVGTNINMQQLYNFNYITTSINLLHPLSISTLQY